MASQVEIANAALLKLGTSGITSLTDSSPEAKAVNSCFDRMRDAELRAHPWKFAIKRGSIGKLAAAPAFEYSFQYQLPSDYLALIEVGDQWCWQYYDDAVWKIEGQKLLTDIGPQLKLRWVWRVTNTALFDALFDEVLACRIAHEICPRLTQSDSAKDRLMRDYRLALSDARRIDAIERAPEPIRETSWITARYTGELW